MKDPAITALEALGHVKVPNTRCTARYKDSTSTVPGPRDFPVWCDLTAGHEGPHKHVTGHRFMTMDRESLIEMVPLPDICQKCGVRWPCNDAEAVLNAFPDTEPCGCHPEHCTDMPFSLEIWEKKVITVFAENLSEAVKRVPESCTFESVRKLGDEYENRLTEYDWCHLCCQPMLQDKNGPVERWAKIEVGPDDGSPFFAGDCVHESCADSWGRKVLERMRA